MNPKTPKKRIARRDFIKTSAAATVAGSVFLAGPARGKVEEDSLDHRNERPDRMRYQVLGSTNFMCSRLVFGCGAALRSERNVRLLEAAYDKGVNHFDVGRTYTGAEARMADFIKRHGGDIWVTSKAPARTGIRLEPGQKMTVEYARTASEYWLGQLDASLGAMKTDRVDAYYLMGVGNPHLVKSEEVANAFEKAKAAGKVNYFGISTHHNAHECLEAAIDTGWYSLAMIAITPGGWYDYGDRKLVAGKGTLKELRPLLDKARAAGIGLVGMKAARHIALDPYGGRYGDADRQGESVLATFDAHYGDKLLAAPLSAFQRSYAYVLENGLDVVNADMQNFKHFEENVYAARTSNQYFA